jgi:hypothetical protein
MKPLRRLHPRSVRFIAALAACVLSFGFDFGFGFGLLATGRAEEPAQATSPTPEQEAKFIATLTNATLKGRWCGFKDGQLGPDKEDSYTIVSVAKLGGDKWQINARFAFGGRDVDLPVFVQVKWAGDTPVIVVDKMSMGAAHTYSARVMIYEKTYVGWWTAPDHGGLMSGLITNGKH